MALHHYAPWTQARFAFAEVLERLDYESRRLLSIFVFVVDGRSVTLRFNEHIAQVLASGVALETVRRAKVFQKLLQDVVDERPIARKIVLAIDTADLADQHDFPLFSFQKTKGQNVLLLPDQELVHMNYLDEVEPDTIPFEAKLPMSYFSGSTTGIPHITLGDLVDDRPARVRSARLFRSHADLVRFELPQIVQAADDARLQLLAEGFGNGQLSSLISGYAYKFCITMDGNGATCSRTAVILRSQAALLFYESEYELFYTHALRSGIEMMLIGADQDVLDIVRREREQPAAYRAIAENGRAFAGRFLNKTAMLEYTRNLLDLYAESFVS